MEEMPDADVDVKSYVFVIRRGLDLTIKAVGTNRRTLIHKMVS